MERWSVFLVPSNDIRWTAVEAALRTMADVVLLGAATNAADAIGEIAALHPNVVITAASVDNGSARDFLTEVRRICGPTLRLAVLAPGYDPADMLTFAAIRVGAYYLWDDLTCDTLDCFLATAIRSSMFVSSPAVAEAFFAMVDDPARHTSRDTIARSRRFAIPEGLTRRERDLLDALARGWSNARIADERSLKNQTVRRYISELCTRIGVASRNEAIVWAKDRGFGTP
jgi:DNA-binding NarL/FixJ family response regulator